MRAFRFSTAQASWPDGGRKKFLYYFGGLFLIIIVEYTPKPYSNYQGPCIRELHELQSSCSVASDDTRSKPWWKVI